MLPPIIIDEVHPRTPTGAPAKAVVGERVPVTAEIFRDGHDILGARVRWRPVGESNWDAALLALSEPGLDRWTGWLVPEDASVEMEAKKAAGYFTPAGAPSKKKLKSTIGRDLGKF